MNRNESKQEIYAAMKFTPVEIAEGERIYRDLTTIESKNKFVELYPNDFNGQLKDGYWEVNSPSTLTNEVKVAIINFAAHESYSNVKLDPKVELARKLFHSFNSTPVSGPQELFMITCWWLDLEKDEKVRDALVTALIDYTTVTDDAKQKILNLIPNDPIAIESLMFWLTHNFPRNYDFDFGIQVKQKIDKQYLRKATINAKEKTKHESRPPREIDELLKSLSKNNFKVSFNYEMIAHPDPREGGYYEQPVVSIGDRRIQAWSTQVLFIEERDLLCLLAESNAVRWDVEVTIANLKSLQITSVPPEFFYSGEAHLISSDKNTFYIKAKKRLLSVDVSGFPVLKTSYT